jgi:hypothetical protein
VTSKERSHLIFLLDALDATARKQRLLLERANGNVHTHDARIIADRISGHVEYLGHVLAIARKDLKYG